MQATIRLQLAAVNSNVSETGELPFPHTISHPPTLFLIF